jgi:hypothetical protein
MLHKPSVTAQAAGGSLRQTVPFGASGSPALQMLVDQGAVSIRRQARCIRSNSTARWMSWRMSGLSGGFCGLALHSSSEILVRA